MRNGQSTKTGVYLRWHTQEEYRKLNKAQRRELWDWQNSKKGQKTIKREKDVYLASKNGGRTELNKLTKKQLVAKAYSLETEGGQRTGGGGSNHEPRGSLTQPLMFTETQVSALLSASESSNPKGNQDKNANDKRTSEDGGMKISALQLQSILKRQKRA